MICEVLMKATHLYGLIGYPLGHSFSGRYFSEKFEREGLPHCRYELFPIARIEMLPELIARHPTLRGLNVTIPYKEKVLAYARPGEAAVAEVGAANTLVVLRDGLLAYNTDVWGFELSLVRWLGEAGIGDTDGLSSVAALVLGTGGAAKAVTFVLRKLRMKYARVSRDRSRGDLTYGELTAGLLSHYRLIVNTTPLGMAPQAAAMPAVPLGALGAGHFVYDLVYNPSETRLLAEARKRGARVKNGLEMLYLQAEASWRIWERHHPVSGKH